MIAQDRPLNALTLCLDMAGCPNRCRHCWLGVTPNGHLTDDDLTKVAAAFRPWTQTLEIVDWYREPDYPNSYRERWQRTSELSDVKTPHFELMSFWRAARDPAYVPWLKSQGVQVCQLTLFGGAGRTDQYVGRKGAFDEVMSAIEQLLDCRIAPRLQVFVNQENLADLCDIAGLVEDLELEKRCEERGLAFSLFVHQGSCDGENEALYDIRLTAADLEKIPSVLTRYTREYFDVSDLQDVFGQPEQTLYEILINDRSTASLVTDHPVFLIDKDLNVYPNLTTPAPFWCLGNLNVDDAREIIRTYQNHGSLAQQIRWTVPLNEMVRACGDPLSQRLFSEGDYIMYLLNRYSRYRSAR